MRGDFLFHRAPRQRDTGSRACGACPERKRRSGVRRAVGIVSPTEAIPEEVARGMSPTLVTTVGCFPKLTGTVGAGVFLQPALDPAFVAFRGLEATWVAFIAGVVAASILAGIVLLSRRGRREDARGRDSARPAAAEEPSAEAAERDRMRAVIASLGEAVVTVDPESRVTLMNFTAERLTGCSQDEALGRPLTDVVKMIDEETREPVVCPVERVLHEGRIVGFERFIALVGRDGSGMPISLTASPIRDRNLRVTGVVLVFRDVQEGRSLRLQTRQYRMMVEQAGEGMAEVDMKGNIVLANAAMAEMHGYRSAELIGKPLSTLRAPNQVNSQAALFALVRKNGHHAAEEMHVRKDGAEFAAETKLSLLKDRNGAPTGMVVLTVDITERRGAQMQLQQAKDLAEAASRSKSEFLANMSHEIRTPMNGIMGMTDLALETQLTREQKEYLRAVKSSADALLNLLNDILDISKIEAGKLELEPIEFDLRMTVAEILKTLAVKAHEKRLELIYRVHPDVPNSLVGDVGRVRQILVNLVGNAVKFTEQGEIAVHVASEDQSGGEVRLHFSVKDTGLGVPKDKQNRIFGAFSQGDSSTTRKFGGSGLGLTICAQLVKLMGGVIWIESPPAVPGPVGGPGSEFHFTARFKVGRGRAPLPVSSPLAETGTLRVLVVDDNATSRRLLEDMLKKWTMQLRFAAGGRAAMELLKETREAGGKFDIVLLDADMPGMDGFAVAETIGRQPEPAGDVVMMLTSVGIREDSARCRELGVSAYVVKPITPSDLHDAIVHVLESHGVATAADPVPARETFRKRAPSAEIILGEDNPVNQMLAVKLLEKRNYKVTVAADGAKVLAALEADPERYALILMDIQMPGMDGAAATAAIREREKRSARHIPIIALTAHAMKGDRERCLAAGMDDYVTKPIRANEIYSAIERNLARESAAPPPRPPKVSSHPSVSDTEIGSVRAEVLARVDDDRKLLVDVAGLFFEEYPKLLARIRESVENGAAPDVAAASHTMKGMLANLGATAAAESALALELGGKSGDLSDAENRLEALEKEVDRFASVVGKMIEETTS